MTDKKRPGLSVRVAEPRKAAVALIQREDGRVLCAWNLRYNGFSLPGGMVEDGETTDAALRRELREETSCEVATSELIFEGEHNLRPKTGERGGRASIVALTNNNELHTLVVKPGELINLYLHAGIHCTACGSRHPCKEPVQVELSVDADGLPRIVIESKYKALVTTFEELRVDPTTRLPSEGRSDG